MPSPAFQGMGKRRIRLTYCIRTYHFEPRNDAVLRGSPLGADGAIAPWPSLGDLHVNGSGSGPQGTC